MLPLALLALLALRMVDATQCAAGILTACPAIEDCCASQYSPTKFGCTVPIDNALFVASQGCGDGLPSDGKLNTSVCCKPGPGLAPSSTLKNVLVIGDSVSIGYTTIASENIVKQLAPIAQVQHGPFDVSDGGAKDTAMGVACLDRWLITQSEQPVKWDLITFNFGLHDMTDGTRCEGLYKDQLTNITRRLASLGTKVLFVTTTPFMPLRTQNNTVVEDMNAIAKAVVAPYAAGMVDLYSTVTAKCGAVYTNCSICDQEPCKFHYNADGWNELAAVVAAAIRSALD
jgi:lysophospholipase L1-like esterase